MGNSMWKNQCKDCQFYNETRRCCHRFPPQIILETDSNGNTRTPAIWPFVRENDCCGEFNVRDNVVEQWVAKAEE